MKTKDKIIEIILETFHRTKNITQTAIESATAIEQLEPEYETTEKSIEQLEPEGKHCTTCGYSHDPLLNECPTCLKHSAREEVYVECGKNAQTHYVVSTKAETDMAYIPVRKLTPQQPSEEEIHKLVNKYLIIEESLCADDYPYFTMKGAKAIKELLNR